MQGVGAASAQLIKVGVLAMGSHRLLSDLSVPASSWLLYDKYNIFRFSMKNKILTQPTTSDLYMYAVHLYTKQTQQVFSTFFCPHTYFLYSIVFFLFKVHVG